MYFELTDNEILQYKSDKDRDKGPAARFPVDANCTVLETKLRPFSFQVVTSTKFLHASGKGGGRRTVRFSLSQPRLGPTA
jgi:hypothetical protein